MIGAACLAVVSLGVVLAPKVTSTMDGYKLESLRSEEQRLLDERRALDLQEAQLLSPERLERLAKGQNLVTPASARSPSRDAARRRGRDGEVEPAKAAPRG